MWSSQPIGIVGSRSPSVGGSTTPSLVQMVSSSGQSIGAPAFNNINFSPPNNVGPQNCLVVFVKGQASDSSVPTFSVSDSINGSWPSAIRSDTGDFNTTTSAFVLPGGSNAGGTMSITMSANVTMSTFQYEFYEWNNIALSSPGSGSVGAPSVLGASLACGSFTPTNNNANGGNLIIAYFGNTAGDNSGQPTDWVPGGAFNLLEGDIWSVAGNMQLKGSMYLLQSTSAAINPSMTCTGDTSDKFNCTAIALKVAGTATGTPPPTTMYVRKMVCFFAGSSAWASPADLRLAATGNLRILLGTGDANAGGGTPWAFTDNEGGGTWNQQRTGNAVVAWSQNKAPNQALRVTATGSGAAGNNGTIRFFDVANAPASTFDNAVSGTVAPGTSTWQHAPDITPTTSGGLVVACQSNGGGPMASLGAQTPGSAVFLCTEYPGIQDDNHFDSGDGYAMYYNPNTSLVNWSWVCNGTGPGGDYAAACFKGF